MPWHPVFRHSTLWPRQPLKVLGSGLATVLLIAATGPSFAADFGGNDSSRYATPYDDPRYADIYGERRYGGPQRHDPAYRLDEDDDDGDDVRGSFKDQPYDEEMGDDDQAPPPRFPHREGSPAYAPPPGYLPPAARPPRFADDRDGRCVPPHVVKRRLYAAGWDDLQDLELAGDLAIVSARRQSGRMFELRVDRCSGEVIDARPYQSEHYGPRRSRFRS